MSVDEQPGRTDAVRPAPTRAELRYPTGNFYRRVTAGTLLPGAGLLRTRFRVLGVVMALGAVVIAVYLAVRVWRSGLLGSALDIAVQPVLLQRVAVVVVVGAVLWMGSIVLTAHQSWPRVRTRAGLLVAFTVVACAVVAAPAAVLARYLDVQASVINEVFVSPPALQAGRPTVIPAADDPWANVPRVNTLLIGSDAGKDREGVRTDSLMVVSTDTRTGDTLLIGIPRNLENVPFPKDNPLHALYPAGYNCGDECLMNAVWTLAEGHPDLFPGVASPGRTSTIDVVGEITGLDIDHSAVINLRGFKALVDAMGGVDINVQQRVCVECHTGSSGGVVFTGDTREWIELGAQHLDGRRALWYARSRAGSDDFSRMRRQRCVAGALITQADPGGLLARYPQLATVVKDNVSIDIPTSDLTAWVELVQRIQEGDSIRSLPLTSSVIRPANPDFAKIRSLVQKGLDPPAPRPSAEPSPGATSTAPSSPTATSDSSATPATPAPTQTPDDSEASLLTATC